MRTRDLYCATCGTVARFVKPPCMDSHDGDCPEWACTRCGAGLLADLPGDPALTPITVRATRRAVRPARTAA